MDATVAWNHVDLRFKADRRVQLVVELTTDELRVAFIGQSGQVGLSRDISESGEAVGACDTCGQASCFRHIRVQPTRAKKAFVVDEVWPEFADYIREERSEGDRLLAPVDGRRLRKPQYAWEDVNSSAWWEALVFSRKSRGVSQQGALRQRLLLERAKAIAERLASRLTFDETELVVQLSFLPFLWQAGELGGRRFSVLMTRMPMDTIQKVLDDAFARFPDRALLADYRAPDDLVRAEEEALAAAYRVVTPNLQMVEMFPSRAQLLPWTKPAGADWKRGAAIGFPGPTVSRKGAYEVREAAKRLGLEVVLGGSELEGAGFWDGVRVRKGDVLDGTFAVVQPALLEDKPRALLRAQAAGCPIVCTTACGLQADHLCEYGDDDGLVRILSSLIG